MAERSDNKKNMTVFGTETEFYGDLEFTDRLVITGKFAGTINAPQGDLEVAKNAECSVDNVEVSSLVVFGNVKGDIKASDRVEICSGSVVDGNIEAARFRIANNVDFNGHVTMLDKEVETDLFSVASSEFKQSLIIHSDVIK